MPFVSSEIAFEDLYHNLLITRDWLNKEGIKTENSRFSEILLLNEKIVRNYKTTTLDEVIQKYGNANLWYALIDGNTFVDIYQSLSYLKSHQLPRGKLSEMLKGPLLPFDEDPCLSNTHHSRDTLFELKVAAKYSQSGISVSGFDDVDFSFEGNDFNIQCKRLHSASRVNENVEKAIDQFTKKMNVNPSLKGLLGFSVEKISGVEGQIFEAQNKGEAASHMRNYSAKFIQECKHIWTSIVNPNILAILVFFEAPVLLRERDNMLYAFKDLAVQLLCGEDSLQMSDTRRIKQMYKKLISQ